MKTLKEVEDFFGKEFTARELADIIEDLDFYTDEIKSLSNLENEANAEMTFVLGTLAGNAIAERIEEGRGVKVTDDQMDEIVKLGIEVAQNKYPSLESIEPGIDNLLQGGISNTEKTIQKNSSHVLTSFSEIGNAMKSDSAMILKSPTFGDVTFSNGTFGDLSKKNNGGYGINHIVESRYIKDGLSKKDIASLLYLIKETVETTSIEIDETKTRQNIVKDGISVTLRKDFDGIKQNWIVTGFAENDKDGEMKKEAADAIKAVNAQYGYAPEHLFVSEQVGAVIASLNTIAQNIKKSSDFERIKNFKAVYNGTQFIKNIMDENMESTPELKTHNRLKEDDVKNLEIISDEDFSNIVDSMLLNDYKHIPNVIRLPNIRDDLAEKLGLEKDAAFIMKNGISHIRPSRKGNYNQALSDEEYRLIPQVLREATFAVIDKRYNNFQIVFDDIENDTKKINKIVFNKDKLGNYLVTVGKINRRDSFSEEMNKVVGVGVAPTISALRREPPATRLRPSPTTDRSIAQEENSVNEKNATATAANFVLEKLKAAGIEVVADKGEMREILESGKRVQKMAAFHGTAEAENSFSGYGTYVVSVNEGDAKRVGMKVAQKKVGDAFYVQNQPLAEFLGGHGFSPYWSELLKQRHFDDANELHSAMMLSDTKGNEELDRQKGELSTLFKYGLVEYKRERTFVYSIDIPDDNGNNYLLYEKPIGLEHARRINDALEKTGTQWRVTRNDGARQIYFNTLSEKVFGGNQEEASRFLKEAGFAGMKMNDANYIVFDEKDISVNKRVQYMMDKNGEVYGFAHKGKIYLDPDLLTANAPAHEYTHLWDAYAQRTNPDLWEKGKAVFAQTRLWEEVKNDPNYADIADDEDLVLSEVHSRICGELAQKVLERMAEQDGKIAKDRAIDWDNEVARYIAGELGAEFPAPELGSENYVSDSVRHEIAREFLSRPMKDLMEGKRISRENPTQDEKFLEAVKNYLKNGIAPKNNEFILRDTPEILQYAGIPNREITMTTGVLNKAKNGAHKLGDEEIISALKGLANPVIVFDSDKERSEAKGDSVLILTEAIDKDNKPLAIGFEMSVQKFDKKTEYIINQIHSIHPRTTLINSKGENMLEKWTEKGLMKYVDDKKISEWLGARRVQFPLTLANADEISVADPDGKVKSFPVKTKSNFEKNSRIEPIQKMAEEHAFPDVREYFKFNITDNENFGKALDNFDGLNPLQLIKVGEIPPVMKALGISDNPIEMPQSVVSKALREEAVYPNDKKGHALTMEHVKRIPESLADPIMVFKSRTRDDSYVFFTEQKDDANRSVIIPVAVDKRYGRLVINEITSIYGKDNEAHFVKANIEQGNLVYADKKRSLEWERECQVQFLAQVLPSEGSYSSILTKENLVNFISAVGNEKIQKMAMSVENEKIENSNSTAKEIESVPDHDPNDGLPSDFVPPEERPDYTDENGEPRWLSDDEANGFGETAEPEKPVDFLVPESVAKAFRENPAVKAAYGHDMDEHSAEAYAEEIFSILKEFSKVDSSEWNLSDDEKIAVAGISKEITEIGRIPREESVAEIRTYFMSEPYRNGKEDLGEAFSKIISTKDGSGYGFDFKMNANQKFNAELEKFISGELPSDHVFSLGTPNALLEKCGFPGGQNIELSSSHLKGKMERHNFEAKDVKNLVSALNDPVAVFAYGDEKKAENAIVELQKDGKNFLVGVHFNQERNGTTVSSIRGLFDRETEQWLNWIDQGKMIYGNKEKIQAVIDQQRSNLADVEYLDLDSVNSILESFGNVKQIFTKDSKVYGMLGTEVPEFAMIAQSGLKTFRGMTVTKYDTEANSWTLSNEDGERVVMKDKALKELTSKESEERAKRFTENTSAIEKVLETQYDDFFRQRENTANNFRHNLSVYCRKEANSPLDALRVANALVKDMSAEERRKTKGLLKSLRKDGETVNEVIVDTYFNAIKETPLNEEHLKAGRYAKIIARPMYDMISARGAKIDGSFDLKIGDTVSGIAFKTDKTFGIGKDKIFQKCEIISASKENNMVTLMDGNKSFYDIPRDTFLKEYARREKYENKQEKNEAHKKHIMRLDIER